MKEQAAQQPPAVPRLAPQASGTGPSVAAAPPQQAAPQAAPYASDERLVRLSLKVFNCTPEQLLPLVRSELERLLEASPAMLEGYVRPGVCVCVFFWGGGGRPLRCRSLAAAAAGPPRRVHPASAGARSSRRRTRPTV